MTWLPSPNPFPSPSPRRRPARKPRAYRPTLELLERRDLLSTVQFAAASFTVSEGQSVAEVELVLDEEASEPVQVTVSASDGSAVADFDYAFGSESVTFSPGEISRTVQVSLLDDSDAEDLEEFYLSLSEPEIVEIGSLSFTTVFIQDDDEADDRPEVTVEAFDASATEDSPTDHAAFRVLRTGGLDQEATVSYTVGGTATPSVDYQPLSGSVTFLPDQTYVDVFVVPEPDGELEPDETVTLSLSESADFAVGEPASAALSRWTLCEASPSMTRG